MLLKKNKNQKDRRRSINKIGSDFRRNSVVISKKQREVAAHKQSVTQRQIDNKKRQKSRLFKRRVVLLSLLALVSALLVRYQVSDYKVRSNVSTIKLSKSQQLVYKNTMIEYSNSHLPLKQAWLLDKPALISDFKRSHPEVSSIELSLNQPFSTKINAKLGFRKPIFIWKGVGETYFIDKEGVLFTKNMFTKLSPDSLPVIEDQGGVAPDPGQTVLTDTIVSDIAKIYDLVPKIYPQQNKVNQIILPPAAREIRAKLDGLPYYVKFSTERSIDEQTGELGQIVNYLKSTNVAPAEYIDVRVPSKSFYK